MSGYEYHNAVRDLLPTVGISKYPTVTKYKFRVFGWLFKMTFHWREKISHHSVCPQLWSLKNLGQNRVVPFSTVFRIGFSKLR